MPTMKRTAAGWFAHELNGHMKAKQTGVRTLARKLNPSHPETARRALYKYLSGQHLPRADARRALEFALDVEHGSLEPEGAEDDEEAADLAQRLADVVRDLVRSEMAHLIGGSPA